MKINLVSLCEDCQHSVWKNNGSSSRHLELNCGMMKKKISNEEDIPSWCPLEDYEEYKKKEK